MPSQPVQLCEGKKTDRETNRHTVRDREINRLTVSDREREW